MMRARAAPKRTSPSPARCCKETSLRSRKQASRPTGEQANRNSMENRPALGKGLSALIPDAADALTAPPRAALEVDVDQLEPNHYQPRGPIDAGRLDELARSIKAHGVIQPIVVRRLEGPMGGRERYQIIAGERRWRAAQQAELARVPIVVKDVPV